MPELPEVETVRLGLKQELVGDVIDEVVLRRSSLRIPIPEQFVTICQGAEIVDITRRAKYFLMHLSNRQVIIGHLGMSGKMLVYPAFRNSPDKHDHVIFKMQSGKEVVFHDPRRFGLLTLSSSETLASHTLLAALGPEPLSDAFTPAYLHGVLQNKKTAIKPAIMDGRIVVGVGNIYASEALFRAGISPEVSAKQLSLSQCERLVGTITEVLDAAIASGGSTLRDYVRSSGDVGYFQHQFAVYGRDGEACFHCASPIKKVQQIGRSTFYCPSCQVGL